MRELIKKILNEHFVFLESKKTKWTLDMLQKIASKYKTANEFKINDYAAYQASHRYGYWDIISGNFTKPKHSKKWKKEEVEKEAEKYETNRDFSKGSPLAYSAAVRNGWIEEIRKKFRPLGNRMNRMVYVYEFPDKSVYVGLTFDEKERQVGHTIKGTVFKYGEQTGQTPEFKKISVGYVPVKMAQNLENCTIEEYRSRGWKILNIAKAGGLGACERIWTKDKTKEESKKFETLKDFYEKSPNAHRVAYEQNWLDEIMRDRGWEYERKVWTKDEAEVIAKKYQYKNSFKVNEPQAYSASLRNGWIDDITKHMEDRYTDWTFDMIQDIANKYKTRTEFATDNKTAYNAALRNNWLDEVTKHMTSPYKKWTFEEIENLSKKYKTRTQFKKNERTPYEYGYRKGWIDIIYPKSPIV